MKYAKKNRGSHSEVSGPGTQVPLPVVSTQYFERSSAQIPVMPGTDKVGGTNSPTSVLSKRRQNKHPQRPNPQVGRCQTRVFPKAFPSSLAFPTAPTSQCFLSKYPRLCTQFGYCISSCWGQIGVVYDSGQAPGDGIINVNVLYIYIYICIHTYKKERKIDRKIDR